MSEADTYWPAVTAMPLSLSDPAAGSVEIFTAARLLAGVAFGSLKPKSAVVNWYAVSSFVVTVLSAPDGASFTDVTSIVIVFADGSRSTPLYDVPPSSCTWKVKLAYGEPLAFAAGENFSFPPAMSATETKSPPETAMPLSVSVPCVANVVILTAARALAGESFGSVKPKSAAANV